MESKIRPGFGSHLPILIKSLILTKNNVVECGTGYNSTPVLHWLCKYMNRPFSSIENNRQFYLINKAYESRLHKVEFIKMWDTFKPVDCGLLFVDCRPAQDRKEIIRKMAHHAQMIVIHDSQDTDKASKAYEYKSIYPLFKYAYHCQRTNTSVLSNSVDVADLFSKEIPY